MTREMVNMTRVDTKELAKKTRVPTGDVDKVVKQIIADKQNGKRKPKPPAPEGGISLSGASRKYGISHQTLSTWAKKGYIPILLRTNKELYVDEAALVELVRRYKENPGQGKRTVKPDNGS